ncbi:hypothetical protein [Fibrobacter sp.]|uniref:hypothetical protein n=1 Tax=Fibrobacter sp. TaxID=35828 RepID=UPI00388F6144
MADDYALSEPRKMQYEEAVELLKDPYLGVSKPDYSDDPTIDPGSAADAAISMPWLKFPPTFYSGFPQAYWKDRIVR